MFGGELPMGSGKMQTKILVYFFVPSRPCTWMLRLGEPELGRWERLNLVTWKLNLACRSQEILAQRPLWALKSIKPFVSCLYLIVCSTWMLLLGVPGLGRWGRQTLVLWTPNLAHKSLEILVQHHLLALKSIKILCQFFNRHNIVNLLAGIMFPVQDLFMLLQYKWDFTDS